MNLKQHAAIVGAMSTLWLPATLYMNALPLSVAYVSAAAVATVAESALIWGAVYGTAKLAQKGFELAKRNAPSAETVSTTVNSGLNTCKDYAASAINSAGNYFGNMFSKQPAQQAQQHNDAGVDASAKKRGRPRKK